MSDGPPAAPAPGRDVSGGRFTRRRLIRALGVAGGVAIGAMEVLGHSPAVRRHSTPFRPPGQSDFHLQGRANDTSVLVLGGGDAGLVAAYELEKAGYLVELLEARDRPGGRVWTIRGRDTNTDIKGTKQTAAFADGHHMNAGPARIPQHHPRLLPRARRPDRGLRQRQPQRLPLPRPGRGRDRAADRHALDSELSEGDQEALVDYLRTFGSLGGNHYFGSAARGYEQPPWAALQAGTLAPPYALSDLLASQLGVHFAFEQEWDQAMPMFEPVGGMDRIPHALSRAIKGTQRFGAKVSRIDAKPDGVEVEYVDAHGKTVRTSADYCVCTIPPQVLRTIAHNLGVEVTAALADLLPAPVGKIGLQFGRRFWEEDARIFGGVTDTNLDIGSIFYPSYGFHGDRGVVIGYCSYFGNSQKLAALSPE